jgi:hypothetical protein
MIEIIMHLIEGQKPSIELSVGITPQKLSILTVREPKPPRWYFHQIEAWAFRNHPGESVSVTIYDFEDRMWKFGITAPEAPPVSV